MYWLVPKFGFGNVPAFISRTAFGSRSEAGMVLPGKGCPGVKPFAAYIASLAGSVVTGTMGTAPFEGTV